MSRLYLLILVVAFASLLPFAVGDSFQKRVFGGTAAKYDQFKFLVGLYVNKSSICTGFIINKHYIGTAAHCIPTNFLNTTVFSILTYLNDTNLDEKPETTIGATVIYKDYRFNFKTIEYDIALLRTTAPLTLGTELTAITLADELPESGATVYTCGYGDTRPDFNNYSLNYADVHFVTKEDCLKYEVYSNFTKLPVSICADSNENKSSCFGDSGGALFTTSDINNPTDAKAIGIVSFGKACGTSIPVVYTDIPNFGKAWFADRIARSPYCPLDCRQEFRRCLDSARKCRLARKTCISGCILI